MKPGSQIKVILMSFFSIVVMVAIITTVSIITSSSLSSESAAGEGHSTEAASAEHGSEAKPAEDKKTEAKPAEHGSEAKPAEEKKAEAKPAEDKKTEAKGAETKTAEASGGKAAAAGNAEAGAKVFLAKTCTTCHTVSKLPEAKGAIGPKLDGLGARAGSRKPGTSADAYIKESIENPTAFVVPNFPPAMPPLRASMTDQEFTDLVAFLHSL